MTWLEFDFAGYLHSLVNSLAQMYRQSSKMVTVQVDSEKIYLNIDLAIPCGLIINELVTNSLKYAFPSRLSGTIQVACHRSGEGRYTLAVRDDGVGLPDGFEITHCTSLGLKLVAGLVEQLEGDLLVDGRQGTCFEIHFLDNSLISH